MSKAIICRTPLGPIGMGENGQAICRVTLDGTLPDGYTLQNTSLLRQAAGQLLEYLAGTRRQFELPLEPDGTPFQREVWNALLTIPYGETRSYRDIARQIGRPDACRAMGRANACNPVAIFIPCHRVIGASGGLTGYAGGLPLKEALLRLEASYPV